MEYCGVPFDHASEDSFCIIMLPDSQNYVKDKNNLRCFESQIAWIFKHRDKLNIKFVTHVGDISNDNEDEEQFRAGFFQLGKLNGAVPYGICAGNHDMNADGSAPYFDKYFPADAGRFRSDWLGSYDGTKHNAQMVSAGERKLLFIHLAYIPSDGAVEWAAKLLEEHRDAYAMEGNLTGDQLISRGEDITDDGEAGWGTALFAGDSNVSLELCSDVMYRRVNNTGDGDTAIAYAETDTLAAGTYTLSGKVKLGGRNMNAVEYKLVKLGHTLYL